MNNKAIGIVVAILIIAGIGYFVFAKKGTNQSAQTTDDGSTTQTTPSPVSSAPNQSLSDLLISGQTTQCTFSSSESGTSSQGTFYVGGGKARGDFTSTVNGQSNASHMILDGQTSYVWIDGQKTGFKTTAAASSSSSPSGSSGVDVNKKGNYNCSPWTADASLFTLPSGVTFTDFSTLKIPSMPTPTPGN